jgi:hypothetical protein
MNIQDLTNLLLGLMDQHGKEVEVRIGDQIEAGPYFHASVGGVWTDRTGSGGEVTKVILCANDDDPWTSECDEPVFPVSGEELPLIWKPSL